MRIRAPSIIMAITLAALMLSAACGGQTGAGALPTALARATATAAPPTPTPVAPQERIAFVSTRDGNDEIYAMNPDGSSVTRLTNHPARDWQPVWSPDGRRIAFVSLRDGNGEIYAMNADGSELTRLTNHDVHDSQPVWSPDGRRIAFSSPRGHAHSSIFVMNSDGTEMTPLSRGLGRVDIADSRAEPTAFAVWIPAFAGMTG